MFKFQTAECQSLEEEGEILSLVSAVILTVGVQLLSLVYTGSHGESLLLPNTSGPSLSQQLLSRSDLSTVSIVGCWCEITTGRYLNPHPDSLVSLTYYNRFQWTGTFISHDFGTLKFSCRDDISWACLFLHMVFLFCTLIW